MDLRLFGAVRAERDREDLQLGSTGQKALLAVLAIDAGRMVSLDRLIELLWAEDSPDQAVHTIRVYVSQLRRVIENDAADPEVLLTERGGYRLDLGQEAVDVLHFEVLAAQARSAANERDHRRVVDVAEEALELWSGVPLAEFPSHEFASQLRRRLSLHRAELVESWAEARLACGDHGGVIESLEGLVEEDPYREHAWGLLALTHYRNGRQTQALRTLQQSASALGDVGLTPGDALEELEDRIFRHDASLALPPGQGVHNLPVPVDSFVGRQTEMEAIRQLLPRSRLITVTGPGGSGKTRLAVETARGEIGKHPDGVWLVDLAPIDADQLVSVTMDTLDTPHTARRDLRSLSRYLRERSLLLVLDNCEHVVDDVARLVVTVLENCPGTQILATSREPLRVPGESLYKIPPLAFPTTDHEMKGELDEYDAVSLFLERARSGGTMLETETHLQLAHEIVRRLDGLPLAIELATSRLATLPLVELHRRIEGAFTDLGAGPRTVLPRHRTLQATFDWSYQLLSSGEQEAFIALSILRGDFDLPAAIAVVGTEDAESAIEGLVAKSMITAVHGDEPRYRLLEPLRQYGHALLVGDLLDRVSQRRDSHFRQIARKLCGYRAFDDPRMQARFSRERLHLEATLDHLLDIGSVDAAAETVAGLAEFWGRFGLYEQERRLVERVLTRRERLAPDVLDSVFLSLLRLLTQVGDYRQCDEVIAAATVSGSDVEDTEWSNLRGNLEGFRGDLRSSYEHFLRGLELARDQTSERLPALLINISSITAWMGDIDQSIRYSSEARDAAQQLWPVQPEALLLMLQGIRARMGGDLEEADKRLGEAVTALRVFRSDVHLALALVETATVALAQGNPLRAQKLVEHAFEVAIDPESGPLWVRMAGNQILARIAWEEGSGPIAADFVARLADESMATGCFHGLPQAGELAAEMAMRQGQPDVAANLLASASVLRERFGIARDAHEMDRYRQLVTQLPEPTETDPDHLPDMIRSLLGQAAHGSVMQA